MGGYNLTHSKQELEERLTTQAQTVKYVVRGDLLLWSVDALLLTWTAAEPGPRHHADRSDSVFYDAFHLWCSLIYLVSIYVFRIVCFLHPASTSFLLSFVLFLNTEHTSPPPEASSASTASHHNAPCFVDDIFAALREGVGNDGELTNRSLTQFGICTVSDSSSVLLQLAKETSRNQRNGLEVLHPTEGINTF